MTFIASDLLLEMQALPTAALGGLLGVGLGLWLTGWLGHRFWITVLTSFFAGLYGLKIGPEYGVTQPVVAGLLLALAGGCLALALARLGLFLAYGVAVWQVTLQFAPQYAVPLICIMAGGLFSFFFFRFCVILLTSAAGAIFLGYAGLALAGQQKALALAPLLADYELPLNLALGLVALIGVVIQQRLARAQRHRELRRREEDRLRRRHLADLTYGGDPAGWLAAKRAA